MKQPDNQLNPIAPRANAKLVQVGTRTFLIGGMTMARVTNDIYEVRVVEPEDKHLQIEWKIMKFKNNVFKLCNSFSACGATSKMYIWGGLQSNEAQQRCLDALIEVDVDKCEMRELPLVEKIPIHSASMHYDADRNELIALGGTNEDSSLQCYLYTLSLDESEQTKYQWKKTRLDCEFHKGYLWQHTSHLSKFSYFTGQDGKFLTVIGGCRHPQSPYSAIVEFDLHQMKMTNSTAIKYGLVSHDSVASKESISIFGGANGGDFNGNKIVLSQGKLKYEKGHNAVGGVCFEDDRGFYVIGGVSGPETLNRVVIYRKGE